MKAISTGEDAELCQTAEPSGHCCTTGFHARTVSGDYESSRTPAFCVGIVHTGNARTLLSIQTWRQSGQALEPLCPWWDNRISQGGTTMNFDESTINAVHQQSGFDQFFIEKVLRLLGISELFFSDPRLKDKSHIRGIVQSSLCDRLFWCSIFPVEIIKTESILRYQFVNREIIRIFP